MPSTPGHYTYQHLPGDIHYFILHDTSREAAHHFLMHCDRVIFHEPEPQQHYRFLIDSTVGRLPLDLVFTQARRMMERYDKDRLIYLAILFEPPQLFYSLLTWIHALPKRKARAQFFHSKERQKAEAWLQHVLEDVYTG
jgi:hypothetical protein